MRIFVRCNPNVPDFSDLKSLVERIAPVEEIYIPAGTTTGIKRNFAIVRISTKVDDPDHVCILDAGIKKLNNCSWKGNRLQFEWAKEFFSDRLNKERNEEDKFSFENLNKSIQYEPYNSSLPESYYLKLRKNRGGKIYHIESSKWNLSKDNGERKDVLKLGKKTNFDDDGYQYEAATTQLKDVSNYQQITLDKKNSKNNIPNEQDMEGVYTHNSRDIFPHQEATTGAPALNQAKTKSGTRKGFGTLLLDAEKHPENYENIPTPYLVHSGQDIDQDHEDNLKTLLENIYDEDAEVMFKKEQARNNDILSKILAKSNLIETNDKLTSSSYESHDNNKVFEINKTDILDENGKKNYANLEVFSNIFHREDGIWWGDDGTLKESVEVGNIKDGARFREAEKIGIDIRPKSDAELSKASFKLNFFSGDEDDNNQGGGSIDQPTESVAKLSNNKGVSGSYMDSNTTTTLPLPSKIDKSVKKSNPEINRVISLEEAFVLASSFCRNRTEEEVIEAWKNSRDKLILDYKRKRKEFKKRARNSFNLKNSSNSNLIQNHTDQNKFRKKRKVKRVKI